jgi:hypothetical protein
MSQKNLHIHPLTLQFITNYKNNILYFIYAGLILLLFNPIAKGQALENNHNLLLSKGPEVNLKFDIPVIDNPQPSNKPEEVNKPIDRVEKGLENVTNLVIKLKQRQVFVYVNGKVYKSFPIAIGKPGWETPVGDFHVIEMLKNPGWTNFKTGEIVPPGKNNPLGERWIAFWTDGKDYIGFHGTPNRASVGKAASHGCIRMYNEHVRELYKLVAVGTPVKVEQ